MDSASKRMYDTFKYDIWEDLGPLDPNWFEALTAEAFAGNVSDQDELCANQEGHFKTPFEKSAANSQMCSTPKVFRRSRTLSPGADNESFTANQETLPWIKASPCLLQMPKETVPTDKLYAVLHSPDSSDADLHHSPNKSKLSFAKHISESLGAQIGDISWTSSLNTPPPVPSTLILTKKDSESTVTLPEDPHVVFVRKLFSSHPNASADETVLKTPEKNAPVVQEDGELTESLQASLNGSWKQTGPNAIEDADVRSTVASVLHGSENALSIFFTNSSSISRKVRNERIKRKQIIPAKEDGCDAMEVSPTHNVVLSEDKDSVPPSGNTQWSPLSLSEIQETDSGITKKKQHFVYTVQDSRPQSKEVNCQKQSSPPVGHGPQQTESKNCRVSEGDQVQNVENVSRKNALGISQLSTAPTQDFSEMSEPVKHSTVTEEALCNGFSPSACLSALKRAKQKAKQGSIYRPCEDIGDQEPALALKESSIHDSGFLSVAEHTSVSTINKPQFDMDSTSTVLVTGLENEQKVNEIECRSKQVNENHISDTVHKSGFQTASNKSIEISSAGLARAKCFFNNIKEKENSRHPLSDGEFEIESETDKPNNPASNEKNEIDSSHLTASEKADVKELCTLLEESSSQFEFTQFQTININQVSQKKYSPSLKPAGGNDSDFPCAVDFNESLWSITENSMAELNQFSETHFQTMDGESKLPIPVNKMLSSTSDSSSVQSIQETNKLIKAEDNNLSAFGEGFKTAQGNIVRVSKKCLSKARALFADINSATTASAYINLEQKQNVLLNCHSEETRKKTEIGDQNVTNSFQGKNNNSSFTQGFKMASGKGISISAKAMQKAKNVFKDCDVAHEDGKVETHVVGNEKNESGFKNNQVRNHIFKEDAVNVENKSADHGIATFGNACLPFNGSSFNVDTNEDAKQKEKNQTNSSLLPSQHSGFTTAHYSKRPLNGQLQKTNGFVAASGKSVVVSAQALQKARSLFADISSNVDTQDSSSKRNGTIKGVASSDHPSAKHPQSAAAEMCLGVKESKTFYEQPANKWSQLETNVCQGTSYESAQQHLSEPGVDYVGSGFSTAAVSENAITEEVLSANEGSYKNPNENIRERHVSLPTKSSGTKINVKWTFEDALSKNPDETHKTVMKSSETLQSGFTTARGKQVQVSKKNIEKVKHLWRDIDDDCMNTTKELNLTECRNLNETSVFKSVSSDGTVFISGNEIRTAKTVTGSEDTRSKTKLLLHEHQRSKNTASSLPPQNSGFQTAGGRKVNISSAALKKAKQLWSEYEDGQNGAPLKLPDPIVRVSKPAPTTRGFLAASGKALAISAEALQKAKALFEDMSSASEMQAISVKPVSVSAETLQKAETLFDKMSFTAETPVLPQRQEITQKTNAESIFTTARGAKVHENTEKVAGLWKEVEKDCPNSNFFSSEKIVSSGSGFTTASGKKVPVSAEALNKAMHLLTEGQMANNTIDQLKPNQSSSPAHGNVLQDTEGRRVALSTDLSKANQWLSECDKAEDKTYPNLAINEPPLRTSGFQAANGKPVTFSAKALQKAKALFDDISSTAVAETRETNAGILQEGFVPPPEGANVAKKTLKVHHFNSNLSSLTKMDMTAEEIYPNLIKETGPPVPMRFQDDAVQFSENNHSKRTEEKNLQHCSIVRLDTPHLSGCTTIQQQFLAQEALDCTMALLEDEVRAAQSLTVSLEHIPTSTRTSVKPQNHTGKRPLEDVTDQPPLKRRLLEEFDRTLDGPKGSLLNPVKSCPSGLLKDRRAFQYHLSLHPNVTRPHGYGKNDVETKILKTTVPSAPANSRPANPKTPVFVPPFLNTRTKTPKNTAQQDTKGRTCTFVPPFKKLKTDGGEKYIQAQTEDRNDQSVRASSKTHTFILPSRNKQNTVDDTLPDHTNENPPESENTRPTAREETAEKHTTHSHEILVDLENIELARDMQDMRIRKKSRQTIRPFPGSLFLTKSSQVKRVTLRTLVNGETPQKYSQKQLYSYGVHQPLSQITSETAESFCFNLLKFHKQEAFLDGGGVQLADGGWLIPRNDGTAGKEEFYKALCDTPGVDPKLLSQEWVYNHYRWIVWKLVSMERSFPATMASVCLTPEQVLLQLKYRYDLEVDHSRRPSLRKIMEKDDTSAKTIVLCVCGMVCKGQPSARTLQNICAKPENSCAIVWLTDGWYAIKAQLDEPLTAMLHKGHIAEGVKLMIHGAQLVGSQDACSPLEAPESLMLKICANSTRRVRWDTKLGFQKDPRPFLLPLSSLLSSGGAVGSVDMVILRSYPIQWMERKPDGGVMFRSARAEEKEARRYNSHKHKTMEAIYAKIQAEFENEEKGKNKSKARRQTVRLEDLARFQDGEELHDAVGDDPAYVEAYLSAEQLQTLGAYKRSLLDQRQAELQERFCRALDEAEASEGSCPKRDITTVWRLCITDYQDQTGVYQLSIWKPSSDLQALLKEGCRYRVYNLTTSEGKKRGGSAAVQLTSTKKSHFRDLQASPEWLLARFQPRVSVTFAELKNPDFQPLCGEVDLTGCVISITDQHCSSPAFYLVDGSLNFVKVHSFVSFAQSGWEDVVKLHVLLALSNLQVRGHCLSPTPVLYAGEMTVLSTNPREPHLQQSLCQLRDTLQGQEDFFLRAEERLLETVTSEGQKSFSAVNRTPTSTKVTAQDLKTSDTWQQTVRSLGAFTPVARTPAHSNFTKTEPRSLKRRRALDYLSQIPPPTPLPQLSTGVSPCVKKTFLPPRRSGAPSTAARPPAPRAAPVEEGWVHDDELALIDTQELRAADSLWD